MEPSTIQINPSTTSSTPPAKRSSMKKWLFILGALVVVIGASLGLYIYQAQKDATNRLAANPGEIVIQASGYTPASIKIKKGQIVTWANQDTIQHAITADEPSLELDGSEMLEPGDTFSYSFDKTGTYTYHDQVNGDVFKGIVIVE